MKTAFLHCYHPEYGWLFAGDPLCGYDIPAQYWVVECDHMEDWGSPAGGVEPCDENGQIVSTYPYTGEDVQYFPSKMASLNDAASIKKECQLRWKFGNFIRCGLPIPTIPPHTAADLLPYEEYMRALPTCQDWETGSVFVFFPPEGSEDNELHTHPISDRIITIAQGSGWFICVRDSRLVKYPLVPGTRVWMPRGKLHTFFAGADGLVVESIHNPYVPVSHPQCLYAPPPEKLYYDISLATPMPLPL